MNPKAWLFLLFLFILSDIIANGISAYYLIQLRDRFAKMLGLMLLTFTIEGVCHLFANTDRPVVQYSAFFAWMFWIGRSVRSIGSWMLTLYLFSRRNGHPK